MYLASDTALGTFSMKFLMKKLKTLKAARAITIMKKSHSYYQSIRIYFKMGNRGET